jgi:hypothetical protein
VIESTFFYFDEITQNCKIHIDKGLTVEIPPSRRGVEWGVKLQRKFPAGLSMVGQPSSGRRSTTGLHLRARVSLIKAIVDT